jgi:biotin-(acetyl-CoA carboxylase) ligase
VAERRAARRRQARRPAGRRRRRFARSAARDRGHRYQFRGEPDPQCRRGGGRRPATRRARHASHILSALHEALAAFAAGGFAPFLSEWQSRDGLAGREVCVREGATEVVGVSRGIGPDGALLLEAAGDLRRILSGDVSLRAAA